MSNAPERLLVWRHENPEDERKSTYTADSKRPNCGTFVLEKEDHTLGNLLRIQLLRDNTVRFAGYRMPHPLVFDCHVRVETMDAKVKPEHVFLAAIFDLQNEVERMEKQWEMAVNDYESRMM